MATFGSTPKAAAEAAEDKAISANCSAFGFGFTAQSPITETRSDKHIKNTDDTTDTPGFVFIICKAGLIVCMVV